MKTRLPNPADRARALVAQMTLSEKCSQMLHESPAIPRLGIPAYNWWNECLHGVARAGVATVFPQAIGLAAAWNTGLLHRVGDVIATEARAKHHAARKRGRHAQYFGLTFWTPNINIFRDPRWGRGHETYGECPFLTSRLAVAFIRGLQGDDPRHLKVAACAKHFAVHSGPESARHGFDARVSARDLWETYLPAFEAAVREAGVEIVMGAYNRVNGEGCCGSPTLLRKILRERWGFTGHVTSDCGAVADFHQHHKVTSTPEESAALAVKNGCDLECGNVYFHLTEAVRQGLISEADVDACVTRLFTTRYRLGMFDPPSRVRWARISPKVVDSPAHRRLALQAARESIVLLKNDNQTLPLRKDLKSIVVVGPNAAAVDVLLANYNGLNPRLVTVLEGICSKVSPATQVNWMAGCDLTGTSTAAFGAVKYLAGLSDVIVAVIGLSPRIEGEEGDAADSEAGGDRRHLRLPGVQEELLRELHATGKPVVLVLLNGSAVASQWAHENLPAILTAWYPGEEGGTAVADVLFGDYNPAGRLPVTFYRRIEDLPAFDDYRLAGRTYRYFTGTPLYPFGYGLSYTRFTYRGLKLKPDRAGNLHVTARVKNTGPRAGDEVAQLYVTRAGGPQRDLRGFERFHLKPGQERALRFTLTRDALAIVTENGEREFRPGDFQISLGGSQPDPRSRELTGMAPLTATIRLG